MAVEGGACQAGASLLISDCSGGDDLKTRFSWVDDASSGGAGYRRRSGQLASDSCPGLCASTAANSTSVALEKCTAPGAKGWQRFGTGNKDALFERHVV